MELYAFIVIVGIILAAATVRYLYMQNYYKQLEIEKQKQKELYDKLYTNITVDNPFYKTQQYTPYSTKIINKT